MASYKFKAKGKSPGGTKFVMDGMVTLRPEEESPEGAMLASARAVELIQHRFGCKPDTVQITKLKERVKR